MKKILCIMIALTMLLFFLLAPAEALAASRQGLSLWFEQLLPALLPFSILSYVVLQSNLFAARRPADTHGIAPEEWYVIVCGFLFGFPIGSKLTADLYSQGRLTKKRAAILSVFTNNLSPVFVTTALVEQLGIYPHLPAYALLYGIPLLIGLVLLLAQPANGMAQKNTASRFRLDMQIVDAGIINGFETLIKICGYVVLFSLAARLIHMLPADAPLAKTLAIGCTEVTTGIAELSRHRTDDLTYVLGICFLSWGGVSGFFQTASILSHTDLSMKRYLALKLLFVSLAACGALLFCRFGIR